MPLVSPRQHAYDAWRAVALANLKASNNMTRVASVLICAVVALGPAEFFRRFDCDNEAEFVRKNGADRSMLFADSKRIPTGTAMLIMRIAARMYVVYKNFSQSNALQSELLHFMQELLAQDTIRSVRAIDRVDDITRLIRVILNVNSWNKPREILLEQASDGQFGRQLELMSAMFECEPTSHEEKLQVFETCVERATDAVSSAYGVVSRVKLALQGAPAAVPHAAPAAETDWIVVIATSSWQFACCWLWAYTMYEVAKTWILNAHVTLPPAFAEAEAMFEARPLCEWDILAMTCVLAHTLWRGSQSTYMLLLSVGLLSLQTATNWPWISYVVDGFRYEMHLCKVSYSKLSNTDSISCDNNAIRLKMLCTFAYCVVAMGVGIIYLVDVMTVLVLYVRTVNADDNTAPIYHIPHCFQVCTLYVVTSIGMALKEFVPVSVTHTLNFLLFLMCGGRTFLARYHRKEDLWTTRVSLYASRGICFFVVGTEWFVNRWHGYRTWGYLAVGSLFQQVQSITLNLFVCFVVVAIFNAIRPNRRVFCVFSM